MEVLERIVCERTLKNLQAGPGILDETHPLPVLHASRVEGPIGDPVFYGEVFGAPQEYRWLVCNQIVIVMAYGARHRAVIIIVRVDLQWTGRYRFFWTAVIR